MKQSISIGFQRQLSRRTVLRGAGVTLGIPWLSAMQRAFAAPAQQQPTRRFVSMTLGLGLVADNLNPTETGTDYKPSLYLEPIQDLRDQLTVVSGSSHPGVSGGHRAEACLLTANPTGASGRNSISLDQYMARHLGDQTRFPSLVVSSNGSNSPSYTDNGSMIPAEDSPSRLFTRLFVDDSAAERRKQAQRVRQGRSIMDLVRDDARNLSKQLGKADQQRLNLYFDSVRDLELRLAESEAWASRPKPKVSVPPPVDIGNPNDFVGRQALMSDVLRLALETDSTRFITYHLGGSGGVVPIPGVAEGYHSLSHHGRDEAKLEQLAIVERAIIATWGEFLRSLREIREPAGSLLDTTTVLLTSNLGNASNHDNRNMPVLLAGGGFRHGQHLGFDRRDNYPLPNLFVSLLQRLGLETDQFATSTGRLTGLELS